MSSKVVDRIIQLLKFLYNFKLTVSSLEISLRKILIFWIIITGLELLIPFYLIWISNNNPLSMLYALLSLLQGFFLLVAGIGVAASCIYGFFNRRYFTQIIVWLFVGMLCFIAVIIFTGNYYESLKTIHFNQYYTDYDKSVANVKQKAIQKGEDYHENEKRFIAPTAQISTFSSGSSDSDYKFEGVEFFSWGRSPCIGGGIIYIENDDMSVRHWHYEKLGRTEYYLVSDSDNKEHYRKYYRKLRPHWYLYTLA